jgi:hypothetical protein
LDKAYSRYGHTSRYVLVVSGICFKPHDQMKLPEDITGNVTCKLTHK